MHIPSKLPEDPRELAFYARCLTLLRDARVPFLVGGACALKHHCGILRDTKDLDLFVKAEDLDAALAALDAGGYRTLKAFPHWLAKAYDGDVFVDLIFNSGNGVTPVDEEWFTHASRGRLLGVDVAICPAEEALWSKAFVMERERFDGADVLHVLAARGPQLAWDRVLRRFGDNWRVLLAHLVLFGFVYPNRRDAVPPHVLRELTGRLHAESAASGDAVCRGTLLSREQYLVDVALGMRDGRLPPTGTMSTQQIESWTAAIGG